MYGLGLEALALTLLALLIPLIIVLKYSLWIVLCCSYDEVMFGSSKNTKVAKKKFARENKNRSRFAYLLA